MDFEHAYGYHHLKRAWYRDSTLETYRDEGMVDEIIIEAIDKDTREGVFGEFKISFHELGGKTVAKFSLYEDSFKAFLPVSALISTILGNFEYIDSVESVCEALDAIGFIDMTETKQDFH